MFQPGYFRDRVHGQRIPTGKPLANLARAVLQTATADAIRQLRFRGRIDLSQWVTTFAENAIPLIQVFHREGQRDRARRLLQAITRHRHKKSLTAVRKSLSGPWMPGPSGFRDLSFGFDVFNPNVTEFIRTSAYNLARSTLETAATDATKAYARLRTALAENLKAGETQQAINRAVFSIFADPDRAARVGQTEAARAANAGGLILAMQTGATNATRWLASSDACPNCLELNGQVREHGTPFYVNPKGGPFAVCLFPPLHPHCFCVTTDVIAPNAQIDSAVVDRLRILAYDPSAVPERFSRGERLAASLQW